MHAIRSQGSGGQNVNKVATAIHLRFNIMASSLPDSFKGQLMNFHDRRISRDGIIIIKAQEYKSQEKNKEEALLRLRTLIIRASIIPKKRVRTKPSRKSLERRLESKSKKSSVKSTRRKVTITKY